MDTISAKKASDQAKNIAEKIFHSPEPTREERLQMITASEAAIYLLGKQAPAIHLARLHCLAAKCFLRIQEYNLASWHAQLCEFLTKSAVDREIIDEVYSLDVMGRALFMRGQVEKGQASLKQAMALLDRVSTPAELNQYRQYLSILERSGLPMSEMESSS
jgi:hypothetical protein